MSSPIINSNEIVPARSAVTSSTSTETPTSSAKATSDNSAEPRESISRAQSMPNFGAVGQPKADQQSPLTNSSRESVNEPAVPSQQEGSNGEQKETGTHISDSNDQQTQQGNDRTKETQQSNTQKGADDNSESASRENHLPPIDADVPLRQKPAKKKKFNWISDLSSAVNELEDPKQIRKLYNDTADKIAEQILYTRDNSLNPDDSKEKERNLRKAFKDAGGTDALLNQSLKKTISKARATEIPDDPKVAEEIGVTGEQGGIDLDKLSQYADQAGEEGQEYLKAISETLAEMDHLKTQLADPNAHKTRDKKIGWPMTRSETDTELGRLHERLTAQIKSLYASVENTGGQVDQTASHPFSPPSDGGSSNTRKENNKSSSAGQGSTTEKADHKSKDIGQGDKPGGTTKRSDQSEAKPSRDDSGESTPVPGEGSSHAEKNRILVLRKAIWNKMKQNKTLEEILESLTNNPQLGSPTRDEIIAQYQYIKEKASQSNTRLAANSPRTTDTAPIKLNESGAPQTGNLAKGLYRPKGGWGYRSTSQGGSHTQVSRESTQIGVGPFSYGRNAIYLNSGSKTSGSQDTSSVSQAELKPANKRNAWKRYQKNFH